MGLLKREVPECQQLVSWSLMSLFSTNMAISETTECQQIDGCSYYTVSQKASHLWLAISFTRVNGF